MIKRDPVCCCHMRAEASARVSSAASLTAAAVMRSETVMGTIVVDARLPATPNSNGMRFGLRSPHYDTSFAGRRCRGRASGRRPRRQSEPVSTPCGYPTTCSSTGGSTGARRILRARWNAGPRLSALAAQLPRASVWVPSPSATTSEARRCWRRWSRPSTTSPGAGSTSGSAPAGTSPSTRPPASRSIGRASGSTGWPRRPRSSRRLLEGEELDFEGSTTRSREPCAAPPPSNSPGLLSGSAARATACCGPWLAPPTAGTSRGSAPSTPTGNGWSVARRIFDEEGRDFDTLRRSLGVYLLAGNGPAPTWKPIRTFGGKNAGGRSDRGKAAGASYP